MSNSNKRMRSSSPDNYKEEYISGPSSDDSSNILIYKKENELEKDIDLEIERINKVNTLVKIFLIFYFFICIWVVFDYF